MNQRSFSSAEIAALIGITISITFAICILLDKKRNIDPPHSCEYYLTGAGTYSDSLIIKRDSSQCH